MYAIFCITKVLCLPQYDLFKNRWQTLQMCATQITMDIDDTIKALLEVFAKELQNKPQNVENVIEDMKWKLLCVFASSSCSYNVATSMSDLRMYLETK